MLKVYTYQTQMKRIQARVSSVAISNLFRDRKKAIWFYYTDRKFVFFCKKLGLVWKMTFVRPSNFLVYHSFTIIVSYY